MSANSIGSGSHRGSTLRDIGTVNTLRSPTLRRSSPEEIAAIMVQITLDEINRMDRGGIVDALGDVFEHAPWVAEVAYDARPFAI